MQGSAITSLRKEG